MSSRFDDVEAGPPVGMFGVRAAISNDPSAVDLVLGVYRSDEGKPWVMPVVRKIEKMLSVDPNLNKEYLPPTGLQAFTAAATSMLLGEKSKAVLEGRAIGIQSLSGAGALRIAAEFLSRNLKYTVVYSSDKTWDNYEKIFLTGGFEEYRSYRYWDAENKGLNLKGMLEDLRNAPVNSVIILQTCAHNPTGVDPNKNEWKEIANLVREKGLFPLFDATYQGFASGDLDIDAWVVRYFVEQGFELFCAQSFAKNFGLYNERVGNLTIVSKDSANLDKLFSQFTSIIRRMYSNPPSHGALIVATALNNPLLLKEWKGCIREMWNRIHLMRKSLYDQLLALGTPRDWSHIITNNGMFSFTGLNTHEVDFLRGNHHTYMLKSGRINVCGLNTRNVNQVAKGIHEALSVARSVNDVDH